MHYLHGKVKDWLNGYRPPLVCIRSSCTINTTEEPALFGRLVSAISKSFRMSQDLHILFFPFLAPGHSIPMVDMAKLFSSRGVKSTILTTTANAPLIQPTVDRANQSGHRHPITTSVIRFPAAAAGLPDGCENATHVTTEEAKLKFLQAVAMLRQPFEQALRRHNPDAVITDFFLPWSVDVTLELGLPCLVFQGTSLFALCAYQSIKRHKPLESLPSDAESFVVPGLPHRIEMLRSQQRGSSEAPSVLEFHRQVGEAVQKSDGVMVNSFQELEPEYAEHYRNVDGKKAWHVGPVSLCNKDVLEKFERGDETSIDFNKCMDWLDAKARGSVIYVCFGSISQFSTAQLREIAIGLEAADKPFVWVVREVGGDGAEWLPEGYEERVVGAGKGLIIRGWAPQTLILDHPAVGGFLTHCGWNSCLEGVSAGVPMATWPLFAEQFFNEKLIVEVLGIGIGVGVKEYAAREHEQKRKVVMAEAIAKTVARLMGGGEEAEGMRRRARELGEMAANAVEIGGSSYVHMGDLIEELIDRRNAEGL
ncbi:unnamed protein product [Musa acuminata subsp. malaccensis]|uniref:Glycosyltransferase n=1 Tax=Musa acuminata subsp. malaccensis TaxID=214687 RepID=A0A804K0D4_MUSAM|nr:PREDICTED: scopoletin glucosyltransferase-like [Musa acuminata subsp. malaccensis]CAG1857899.1 unnamed protein product [Musa acuminata subsp. malaccensis]